MTMLDTWRTTVGSYSNGGRGRNQRADLPNVSTVRQATFPVCHCGSRTYEPTSHAEGFINGNWRFVRQSFRCTHCGAKRRLVRRLDRDWTSNMDSARAGVQC